MIEKEGKGYVLASQAKVARYRTLRTMQQGHISRRIRNYSEVCKYDL